MKVYGESEGKEQFVKFDGAAVTVYFDASVLGSKASRTIDLISRPAPSAARLFM